MGNRFLYLIIPLMMAGCIVRNAENIRWDENGNKVEQTRTGEYAIAYWFGLKHYEIYSDPNSFSATTEGLWAKSDPNTVKAIGAAGGSLISESIGP